MLREIAKRLGLAETITGPLGDDRDPARVRHSYGEMAMARMVMIAAGYEGGFVSADTLKRDQGVARCRVPRVCQDWNVRQLEDK